MGTARMKSIHCTHPANTIRRIIHPLSSEWVPELVCIVKCCWAFLGGVWTFARVAAMQGRLERQYQLEIVLEQVLIYFLQADDICVVSCKDNPRETQNLTHTSNTTNFISKLIDDLTLPKNVLYSVQQLLATCRRTFCRFYLKGCYIQNSTNGKLAQIILKLVSINVRRSSVVTSPIIKWRAVP